MLKTIEATIDKRGKVKLSEPVKLDGPRCALVTILDQDLVGDETASETFVLSESALAEGWLGPEADEAWAHLAELPELKEEKK